MRLPILLAATLLATPALALDCEDWMSGTFHVFWEAATIEDVKTCLLTRDAAEASHYDETPLHAAVSFLPEPEVIALLIAAGADVNAGDAGFQTPLHYAAKSSKLEMVRVLLSNGADVDALNDFGETPLHYAAAYATDPAVIELFLDAGADPSLIDHYGKMAWDFADANQALDGHEILLRLLP